MMMITNAKPSSYMLLKRSFLLRILVTTSTFIACSAAQSNNNNNNNKKNSYFVRRTRKLKSFTVKLHNFIITVGPVSIENAQKFGAWTSKEITEAARQVVDNELKSIDWSMWGEDTAFDSISTNDVEYTFWNGGTTDIVVNGGSVSFESKSIDNVPTEEELNVIIYEILNTPYGKTSLLKELKKNTNTKFDYITEIQYSSLIFEVTLNPTVTPFPTLNPTASPTSLPTEAPTTVEPTKDPTNEPTKEPTKEPTTEPTTEKPTPLPTKKPTDKPTDAPTLSPTEGPTTSPTAVTLEPTTNFPTVVPGDPTSLPTTAKPTSPPTSEPTGISTLSPTEGPTTSPTAELETVTLEPTTNYPTVVPGDPTSLPTTAKPTSSPTSEPTGISTNPPMFNPSSKPTQLTTDRIVEPTDQPSASITDPLSINPSALPTTKGSVAPTTPVLNSAWSPSGAPSSEPQHFDVVLGQGEMNDDGGGNSTPVVPVAAFAGSITVLLLLVFTVVGRRRHRKGIEWQSIARDYTTEADGLHVQDSLHHQADTVETIIGRLLSGAATSVYPPTHDGDATTLKAIGESKTMSDDDTTDDELSADHDFPDNDTIEPNIIQLDANNKGMISKDNAVTDHRHHMPALPYWESAPAFAPEIFHCALTPTDVSAAALSGTGGFDGWSDVSSEPPTDGDNSVVDTNDFAPDSDWNPDDNSEDSSCNIGNTDPFLPTPVVSDQKRLLKSVPPYDMEALAPPSSSDDLIQQKQGSEFPSPSPFEIL